MALGAVQSNPEKWIDVVSFSLTRIMYLVVKIRLNLIVANCNEIKLKVFVYMNMFY